MNDKRARLLKIQKSLKKIQKDVDMAGIVFYAAVAPNDETEDDKEVPAFYIANGQTVLVGALIGNTVADMITQATASEDTSETVAARREYVLDGILKSMAYAFSSGDAAAQASPKVGAPPADDEDIEAYYGPQFVKKGGSA